MLWPFLLATVLLSLVPGPATALVIRSGATVGLLRTMPVIAGMEIGVYGWSLAAGAGIAGVVAASPAAFTALKVAGTLVLATWESRPGGLRHGRRTRCGPRSPGVGAGLPPGR